ncbi:hypothetical protein Leryth_013648, partial [Lithospermum erythrorhizon]
MGQKDRDKKEKNRRDTRSFFSFLNEATPSKNCRTEIKFLQ